ncbi:hypothetical protein ACS5PU_01300 [Pedobacter sp. GSP4]
MKNLKELNVYILEVPELMKITGGTDNCKAKEGKSLAYYIGYTLGWLFD